MSDTTLITDGQDPIPADGQQTVHPTDGNPAAPVDGTEPQQQTQQAQPTDGDPADGKDDKGATGDGAPEKYEFQAPEGRTFDPSTIDAFSEVARELNLTQEAAQKVLDKMAPVIAGRQAEQIEALQTEWAESTKADKELGGDKLNENLGIAKAALDKFGSAGLKTLLNDTGAGNNPEIIRLLYRVGLATREDTVVPGSHGAPAGDSKSRADILYDKTK